MITRRALLTGALLLSACRPQGPAVAPADLPLPLELTLEAEIIIPPDAHTAAGTGTRFGGVSGTAALPGGRELLALSDDRENSRVYRLRLTGDAPSIRIAPVATVALKAAPGAPARLDPEGIALLENGHMVVSSEGIGEEEPRVPPAVAEYTPEGRFVRQWPVPSRYASNGRGPLVRGVRVNAGFESLTITPDYRQVFTANEVPLVQDGADDPFAPGARVRILEYNRRGGAYEPGREFAYEIAPLEPVPFAAGFVVNGLVELLAVSGTELLALERGFVQPADRRQGINRIRLFRVSLQGATDVSGIESLSGARIRPARKTLLLDFDELPGLSPSLRNLDNFEALAWVSAGPNAGGALLLASDDNFNPAQVSAFLLLALK